MYTEMKIESIFWLSLLKKNMHFLSLVIKVDNIKITNKLIIERLVLDYTLYKYMRYNLACKIKQYFSYYKYGYILVYY